MDIFRSGIILAVYLFIIFVAYIVISSPFDDIMTDFENINNTASDTGVERGTNMGRTVFDMVFAAAGLIPIIWFIVSVFAREPDWRYRG